MDLMGGFLDIVIHLDKYLGQVIQAYGFWTYLILFIIIFCETGLVVTPFLPGDSLLFTAGVFAATGSFNVALLFACLTLASFLGDNLNYWVGKKVGVAIFSGKLGRFVNREHLARTERFYETHGGKTLILARFAPVVRTFAPFVAGIGRMEYRKFLINNALGGLLWNGAFIFGGYFFGNIPIIRENFTITIFAIIFVSLLPTFNEVLQHYLRKKRR
jgi:membrane-associated protein